MRLCYLFDVCQFVIILHEEGEVLIGDIYIRLPTVLLVFLLGVSSTREGILGNLQ